MNDMDLKFLQEKGVLSDLDVHFGRFMERLEGRPFPELAAASALVSAATREGHIYLDLSRLPSGLPDGSNRLEEVARSEVVGKPGEFKPLIMDEYGRLYLYRYWEYERGLAEWIRTRAEEDAGEIDYGALAGRLKRLFLDVEKGEVDWQVVSAFVASSSCFAVISGGPGTGKTTTAAKILAVLIEGSLPVPLRVALASPTGKGAARLQSAIERSRGSLRCDEEIRRRLPVEAFTIHRLLGSIEGSPYFRHHARNLLPLDVLVIDEASMVDLALMAKLVQALPPRARLILLGDKDQLASVEAGAVLGDICNTGASPGYSKRFCSRLEKATGFKIQEGGASTPPISDCIVNLAKNYRFGSGSGIATLSRAINEGDHRASRSLLEQEEFRDIAWEDLPSPRHLVHAIRQRVLEGFRSVFQSLDPREALGSLDRFRILCALREGPYGAPSMNLLVEDILRGEGLIKRSEAWYPGRPVLISRNDYAMRLYNGDSGIALNAGDEGSALRVFFSAAEDEIRKIHPMRLPEHETCYAMTVHKSQGSEFERVLLILPDRDSPVLTRELVYTAVTRARQGVEIWAREDVFRAALERRTERRSGLREELWERK